MQYNAVNKIIVLGPTILTDRPRISVYIKQSLYSE